MRRLLRATKRSDAGSATHERLQECGMRPRQPQEDRIELQMPAGLHQRNIRSEPTTRV